MKKITMFASVMMLVVGFSLSGQAKSHVNKAAQKAAKIECKKEGKKGPALKRCIKEKMAAKSNPAPDQ